MSTLKALKKGRPATGRTRKKISISIPESVLLAAKKAAAKKDESLSQFISRATHSLLLDA